MLVVMPVEELTGEYVLRVMEEYTLPAAPSIRRFIGGHRHHRARAAGGVMPSLDQEDAGGAPVFVAAPET